MFQADNFSSPLNTTLSTLSATDYYMRATETRSEPLTPQSSGKKNNVLLLVGQRKLHAKRKKNAKLMGNSFTKNALPKKKNE